MTTVNGETGEVIEGTATEIVPVQPQGTSSTLWHTNDPAEVVARAVKVADSLKRLIVDQRLVVNIQGREYPKVEAWTALGSMLGVFPVVEWTRPTPNGGWEARVLAKTLDGRTVGAAESSCTREERTWKSRDDYALRSMAQTRATSKALRGPLGFIVTLAGYEATPEAEMPASEGVAQAVEPEQRPAPSLSPDEVTALLQLAKQAISEDGPWTKELLLRHLVGAGATDTTSVRHGVLTLSPGQAVEFERTVVGALEAHEDAREQVAAQAEAQVDADDARAEAS